MMSEQWPLRKLSEVIEIQNGFAFSRREYTEEGHFLIRIGNVQNGALNLNKPNYVVLNTKSLKFELSEGDLLISLTGNIGRVARVEKSHLPAALNQRVARMKLSDSGLINSDFLYYFLRSDGFRNTLTASGHGTAQKNVSTKAIGEIEIPVPPMEEQQRIVSILDEVFKQVDNEITQAEQKLHNGKELFRSAVEEFFKQEGKDWEEPTLLELLERGWITSHLDGNHGGEYPRKSEFIDEGIRYISANCIRNQTVDLTNSKFLSPERAARLRKGIAQDRDVLFAHNATVGPVAILRTNESKIILGTSLTYYRCNLDYIIPEYLAHYMRSHRFTIQYSKIMRQSTRNQVPITKQREFTHLIPPKDVQYEMAKKFDALQTEITELEKRYQQELRNYEELKQSMLQEAFNGNLTREIKS